MESVKARKVCGQVHPCGRDPRCGRRLLRQVTVSGDLANNSTHHSSQT